MQEEIILAAGKRRDILALLPTGGGKSLCFQIPVLLQEGIGIVISPLVALMEDQVKALQKKGIKALAIAGGYLSRSWTHYWITVSMGIINSFTCHPNACSRISSSSV
ncbi:DEAD/DEAH box helicase [Antarcticibacterium flavum]|uniref:DEAD/DEAH box helicase n=1 Tax=Antarcticibacterium flavum TaxID=2058175 RepID=UPI002938DD9B|nr:DEAD/DEAH box helicase [Antarcticibacterium flavum]